VSSILEAKDLPKELQGIYRCIQEYFNDEANTSMSVDTLAILFFASRPSEREFYIQLFENLKTLDVDKDAAKQLCVSLKKGQLLKELSMAAYNASEGDNRAMAGVQEQFKLLEEWDSGNAVASQDEFEFVEPDLEQLLDKTYLKPGLRWRMDSLNKSLGSLRPGNFGFLFARPETGKTTFLTSEGSYFAEQAVAQNLGPVLHLNNEGEDDNILMRYYQSVLGATLAQILSNRARAQQVFMEKTKGKILLPRLGNFNKTHVEVAQSRQ